MAFFKVKKTMQYTETVYVEAESEEEACAISGQVDGVVNADDSWYDSVAIEVSEGEFNEECNE